MWVPTGTRLCIVRHGVTAWNAEKRIQGHLDLPLTETGVQQAHAIADGLAECVFGAMYSSDLSRAWQTAVVVANRLGMSPHPEHGLRERHSGILEGKTVEELSQSHPLDHARFLDRNPDYAFGHGETMRVFSRRVLTAIDRLADRHSGDTLLVITHGGVLDVVLRRATGRSLDAPRDYPMPNAGINWFEHTGRGLRLIAWAEQYHLDPSKMDSGSDHPE